MSPKVRDLVFPFACLLLFAAVALPGQKIETVDGVRVVHNGKTGTWGKELRVRLELVRTIGELEAEDEHQALYMPNDVAVDRQGNLYVLDSGNHRVQKFGPDGKYLATIGRKGQGPGELFFPRSIDIDEAGNLYVSDPNNKRVQVLTPEGKELRTISLVKETPGIVRRTSSGLLATARGQSMILFGEEKERLKELPKLVIFLDNEGKVEKEFGEPLDYGNVLLNRMGNLVHFDLDGNDHLYLAFTNQNRIEKYIPDGKLLWRCDRELDYSTAPPEDKGKMERRGNNFRVEMPRMNQCSAGIAVDGKGRIWVATLKRQLKKEESAGMTVGVTMDGGQRSMSMKPVGNTELRQTDAYRLDVYDADGTLLGTLPLSHFVDGIRITGDRLFLIDQMRGAQVFEYRIVEKP